MRFPCAVPACESVCFYRLNRRHAACADYFAMITITVNGQPTDIDHPMTIDQLVHTVDVPPNYLAIEINREVVPREQHATAMVQNGDEVEVVTLVGGG